MPRDLAAERDAATQGGLQLHKSPEELSPGSSRATMFNLGSGEGAEQTASPSPTPETQASQLQNKTQVKPYVQALTTLDIESCVKLEDASCPSGESITAEKFQYRFTKCGELSLGLFTSADTEKAHPTSADSNQPQPADAVTASTAHPIYSGTPARKSILLAHVIATKTTNATVADDDMALPDNWQSSGPLIEPKHGHKEQGRTLCIHSLAVLPEFQRQGLGKLIMKSYIQRMESADVADRIALIARDRYIPFYSSLGFENKGRSKVKFGGGKWSDMVLDLNNTPE